MTYSHTHRMRAEIAEFECLYRIYDTYGSYPTSGYGRFDMVTALGQHTKVRPGLTVSRLAT